MSTVHSSAPMAASSAPCCSRLGGSAATAASCRPRIVSLSALSRPFCRRVGARHRTRKATSAPMPAASAFPSFDFSPPPIDYDDGDLHGNLTVGGAKDLANVTIGSFADDCMAIDAAYDGVALVDLTHFGRIRVSGEDRVNFLHNQSTADFNSLVEGEGCDTVFVTATARTIDLAHALVMKNAIILLVSPLTCKTITDMLSRYIFFADKVEVNDITQQTCFFVLLGPKSNQVMEALKVDLTGQPYGTHRHFKANGMPVTVGVGSILSKEGFSLLMTPESAESIWKTILHIGAIPMGPSGWERLRILQGRPAPGKELTNEYNALEAGLWMAISLDKGCYKGQETISRLITYNGVKQRLWGIRLSGPADPGSPIILDDKKVGTLTSYAVGRQDSEHVGLGYIKRKAGSAGVEVTVGTASGTVVEVPFLCHSLQV